MGNYYDDKYGFNLQNKIFINPKRDYKNIPAMLHIGLCRKKTLKNAFEFNGYCNVREALRCFEKDYGKEIVLCKNCFPEKKNSNPEIRKMIEEYNKKIKGKK